MRNNEKMNKGGTKLGVAGIITVVVILLVVGLLVIRGIRKHDLTTPNPDNTSSQNQPPSTSNGGNGGTPGELSIDCSKSLNKCSDLTISGEAPASGLFHGYADPSMRKDPNSSRLYMAYSWPNFLSDGTINIELHVAHSNDDGSSWQKDGTLYSAKTVTNPGSGNYAQSNYSSDEVIDILPIKQGNSTLWVQAHMSYLVQKGTKKTYAQLHQTNYVSLAATLLDPNGSPSQILNLASAPEARLGGAGTDATLNPTQNLSSLNSKVKNCTNLNQPALFYQGDTLYLALQCFENKSTGDGSAAAYFMFSTKPAGYDATQWRWSYNGEFAAPSEATALGKAEGTGYQFFTEAQFMNSADGKQVLLVITPGTVSGGIQPAEQYGCRAIPMQSLSSPALLKGSDGAPEVVAKVTASDLFSGKNQGPAACTYEPTSKTGIVMVRKLSSDPTLGFFVSLMSTGLNP